MLASPTPGPSPLMEVAGARAKAMGISTPQAYNDIKQRVFGRVSPLILDNLGILTGGEAGFASTPDHR